MVSTVGGSKAQPFSKNSDNKEKESESALSKQLRAIIEKPAQAKQELTDRTVKSPEPGFFDKAGEFIKDKFGLGDPKPSPKPILSPVKKSNKNKEESKSFLSAIGSKVTGYFLGTEKDRETIDTCFSKDDAEWLYAQIQQQVPHLRALIRKMVPALDKFFTSDELIEQAILHVVAHLAKQLGQHDGQTVEEFLENCAVHLLNIVGPKLNEIDAKGTPISMELFNSLARELFDALFPSDGFIYKFKDIVAEKTAEGLKEKYGPIAKWLAGEELHDPSAALPDELNHFIHLILEKGSGYFIKKDRKFLKDLTGTDNFYVLMKNMSPKVEFLRLPKDLSEKVLEAAALRAMVNLSKELFDYPVQPKHFIHKTVSFFCNNLHEACRHAKAKQDEVIVDDFYQASLNTALLFLPKFNWLGDFIQRRNERFLKPIAEVHLAFYHSAYADQRMYKERLKKILPAADDCDSNDKIVDQLYNFCHNLTSVVKNKGKDYFDQPGKISKFLENYQRKNPLDVSVLKTLEEGAHQLFKQEDNDIAWTEEKIELIISTFLFRKLICWLEKVPESDRDSCEKLFYKAFELLLEVWEDPFDLLLHSSKDNPFTEEVLGPTTKELFALFSEKDKGIKEDGTLPEKIEAKVMEGVQNKCQSFFANILSTITTLTKNRKESEKELEALFPSKNCLRLCDLLNHMVTQGIPYFLTKERNTVVDNFIMPKLAPLLSKDGKGSKDPKECQLMHGIVGNFLKECGKNTSPQQQELIQFLGIFAKTISNLFILELFTRIEANESQLEKLLLKLIDEGVEHFKAIGDTKRKTKKNKPVRADLVKEFEERDLLHKALKGEEEKKAFFLDLKNKTLRILGIDEKAITSDGNDENAWLIGLAFDLLEAVTPDMLDSVFTLLCDANTINQILLVILNRIVEQGKLDPSPLKKLFPDSKTRKITLDGLEPKFKDTYQAELQGKLMEAIEALVRMHPDRIPKMLMLSEKLKEAAGQAIGQPLREQIRHPKTNTPISLVTLVEQVVGSFLDKIAPGEWNDKFDYYKTSLKGVVELDRGRKPIKADAPNLARYFPQTPKEKVKAEKFQEKQKENAKVAVPKLIRKIMDRETDQIAVKWFANGCAKMEKKLNEKLVAWFGDRWGKIIYNILLPIIYLLRFPFQLIVLIFNYTVWQVVSQIIKLIFNSQADKRAKDVDVAIHDNFAMRAAGLVVDQYDKALA